MQHDRFLSFILVIVIATTFATTYSISLWKHDVTMSDFTLSQSIDRSKSDDNLTMRIGQIGISIAAFVLILLEFSRKQEYVLQRMICTSVIAVLMVSVAFCPLSVSNSKHFTLATMFFASIMVYTLMFAFLTRNPLVYCLLLTQVV